ncbi:MAG: hypothetical protein SPG61_07565, partial [Arcanobacterium sp.]|nr:hypothetical protein [Arcanobacterium sp.]
MFNKVSASAISLALTLGVFTFHPSSQKLELSPAHNSPGTLLIDVFAAPAITAVETTDGVNKSSDFTAENANLQKASPQLKTLLNNHEAMSAETTENKTVENQSTGETPNTESETEIPTVAEEGITTQSTGYELQTAPMELASEFQVVGATWTGATPERIDVRTSINGIWGDWYALEINDSEPGQKNGTEPYIAAGSDGVQLRAIGTTLPTSFDLALLTGTSSNSEVAVEPTLAKELPTPESHSEAALNEAEATTTNGKNISWLDSLQSNDSLHGNSPFPTDGERGKSQSEISGTKWVLPES